MKFVVTLHTHQTVTINAQDFGIKDGCLIILNSSLVPNPDFTSAAFAPGVWQSIEQVKEG